MLNDFSKSQTGGVSPSFAIIVSAIFLVIGSGLYFEGDTVYKLFDNVMTEFKHAVNI